MYLDFIKCTIFVLIILILLLSFVILMIDNSSSHIIFIIIIYAVTALCCKLNYNCVISIDQNEERNEERETPVIHQNPIQSLKVTNIDELHENYSRECCICLENIDPIESFKLSNCQYHIFHEECIKMYIKNKFTRCPVCNIP